MMNAIPESVEPVQKVGFYDVTTPINCESFVDRDQASEWALSVVLGGFAPWADVRGEGGQICRINGPDRPEGVRKGRLAQ